MYKEFFNLDRKPFELLPDPDFIYLSHSHKRALTYLDHGVRQRAGFILLTGDVGSGKTTIIRDLIGKHYDKVVLSKIFNTRITSEQLVAMINDDFGLTVNGKDKVALLRDLNDFLLQQFAAGNQPVLIVDEAQNLGADLLEEVRLLSNLEHSQSKLLQIVMVGQPELRKTLADPSLLQLRQRISINCHLRPLTRQEVAEYVVHRLKVAGNVSAIEFPGASLDLVFKHTRGIPRLINIFCDFVMLAAFAEESRVATLDIVNDVIAETDFENHFWAVTPPKGTSDESPELADVKSIPVTVDGLAYGEIARRLQSIEELGRDQLAILRELSAAFSSIRGEHPPEAVCQDESAIEVPGGEEPVSSELRYLENCRDENGAASSGFARRLLDRLTGVNFKK